MTKCVNLRFRLRIDGTNYFGRIGTDERGRNCLFCDDGKAYWIADSSDELQRYGKSDFEIVPRDPGTYRDWQVGDSIEYSDNYSTGRIIFRSGDFVAADIEGTCNCYTCDELFNDEYRLVLTDIEQQIIEGEKKYEPQDGDICYVETRSDHKSIFIYKKSKSEKTSYYVSYGRNVYERKRFLSIAKPDVLCMVTDDCSITFLRPAKDEEQQKLFDAMAKEGKRWNAEKKVVEDIPKPYEFKKGEPVLVRSYEFHRWIIAAYTSKDELGFIANAGVSVIHWKYCIPYNERTMHLLGTSEDYKEE